MIWYRTRYIAVNDRELLVLLLPPESWNCRLVDSNLQNSSRKVTELITAQKIVAMAAHKKPWGREEQNTINTHHTRVSKLDIFQ